MYTEYAPEIVQSPRPNSKLQAAYVHLFTNEYNSTNPKDQHLSISTKERPTTCTKTKLFLMTIYRTASLDPVSDCEKWVDNNKHVLRVSWYQPEENTMLNCRRDLSHFRNKISEDARCKNLIPGMYVIIWVLVILYYILYGNIVVERLEDSHGPF